MATTQWIFSAYSAPATLAPPAVQHQHVDPPVTLRIVLQHDARVPARIMRPVHCGQHQGWRAASLQAHMCLHCCRNPSARSAARTFHNLAHQLLPKRLHQTARLLHTFRISHIQRPSQPLHQRWRKPSARATSRTADRARNVTSVHAIAA